MGLSYPPSCRLLLSGNAPIFILGLQSTPRFLVKENSHLRVQGSFYQNASSCMHVWQGLIEFVRQVVGQIVADVVRLFNLGFTNIVVTQLAPLGCAPVNTMSDNYTACDAFENLFVPFHNSLLVSNLSSNLPDANILFIDFYDAFYSIFDARAGTTGKTPNIISTLKVFLLSSNPKRKKTKNKIRRLIMMHVHAADLRTHELKKYEINWVYHSA